MPLDADIDIRFAVIVPDETRRSLERMDAMAQAMRRLVRRKRQGWRAWLMRAWRVLRGAE